MKKILFLVFLIFNFSFATDINDAIKAFNSKEYKKSFEMFSKIKSSEALYYIGKQYFYGYGVKKDINKAFKYENLACKQNSPKGCNALGWLYQHVNKYKNLNLSKKYYKKACNELHYGNSCNTLGIIYLHNKNYKNALKYYKSACDLDNSYGCSNLGWFYHKGKQVPKDYFLSFYYTKKSLEINPKNKFAYNLIGILYFDTKNFKKAVVYYKKGCDLNNSWSCENLSWCYTRGKGVKQDISLAKQYAKKACKLSSENCLNLGYIYEIFDKNFEKAFKYYQKACNADRSVACSNVSLFYLSGRYVDKNLNKGYKFAQKAYKLDPQNISVYDLFGKYYKLKGKYKKAFKNFKKSCDLNDTWGCKDLGLMYEKGIYVSKDKKKYLYYYNKACKIDKENTYACDKIKDYKIFKIGNEIFIKQK